MASQGIPILSVETYPSPDRPPEQCSIGDLIGDLPGWSAWANAQFLTSPAAWVERFSADEAIKRWVPPGYWAYVATLVFRCEAAVAASEAAVRQSGPKPVPPPRPAAPPPPPLQQPILPKGAAASLRASARLERALCTRLPRPLPLAAVVPGRPRTELERFNSAQEYEEAQWADLVLQADPPPPKALEYRDIPEDRPDLQELWKKTLCQGLKNLGPVGLRRNRRVWLSWESWLRENAPGEKASAPKPVWVRLYLAFRRDVGKRTSALGTPHKGLERCAFFP